MEIKINPYTFAISAILFIGIFLRYYNIEFFGTFGHDNSRDLIITYKMFKYHEWQFRGPVFSIVWAHLSPIYYYLIFPFYYAANFHPLAPAIFSSFLNIIALFLVWWCTREMFGKRPALIAALIYAVSFLIIKEGALGLNPCFMPMFAILFLYGVFKKHKGDMKGSLVVAVSLAMMVSFHPSGFFVLPVVIALIFYLKLEFSRKELLYSILIFIFVAVLPYLYQQKKFNWWDLQKFMEYVNAPKAEGVGFFQYMANFFQIFELNFSRTLFYSEAFLFPAISAILIILIFIYAFSNWRKPGFINIIALIITLYSIIFGFVMKFDVIGTHAAWFQSVLIPWTIIFMAGLLNRLVYGRKQVVLVSLLVLIVSQNLYHYFIYTPEDDKFYAQKLFVDKIRDDSQGANLDFYGEDTEPFFYMLWYYETNPETKEMYYTWVKWAKKYDSNLAYYIDTKGPLSEDFKKAIYEQNGVSEVEEIFIYNGRSLYKIK